MKKSGAATLPRKGKIGAEKNIRIYGASGTVFALEVTVLELQPILDFRF